MTLIDQLRAQEQSLFVVASGAGASILADLWSPPGASDFLVGGAFPYASEELARFLGFTPDRHCSGSTATDMAMEAAVRAAEAGAEHPLGLAVTAVAGSTRLPRGGLRAWIAIIGEAGARCERIDLTPGTGPRTRELNEAEVRTATLRLLEDFLSGETFDCGFPWGRLFERPAFGPRYRGPASQNGVYLPATLNPIHEGHETLCRMADDHIRTTAARNYTTTARYLVCMNPAHKEPLTVMDALKKVAAVRKQDGRIVEFTKDDPLFLDKINQRPASVFIMGADTLLRMMEPKWGPSFEEILQAAYDRGSIFYVADRNGDNLDNINIPGGYRRMFVRLQGIPEISSSDLREEAS